MGQFRNGELVRIKFMNSSAAVIDALETLFSQVSLDALEVALFPPATVEQTKAAYAEAIDALERKGVIAQDPILAALKAEMSKPVAAEPLPIEEELK